MLILIIAHDLKLFRKREKLFAILSHNKILHAIFWRFPQNRISIFRVNYISKILTLKILFLFHRLSFYLSEKKIGGHRTNYLSGGPNLTPSYREGSFENPQHMLWLRNKRDIFCNVLLT